MAVYPMGDPAVRGRFPGLPHRRPYRRFRSATNFSLNSFNISWS